MDNKQALNWIYWRLQEGFAFGQMVINVKYPYFSEALFVDWKGEFIHWHHYGSSANRNNKKELAWVIKNIFKTTPIAFIENNMMQKVVL